MNKKLILRIVGVFLGAVGVIVLVATIYPIASYEWMAGEKFPSLVSPLVEDKDSDTSRLDYTKASNWFPAAKNDFKRNHIAYYTVSIPSLGINTATVSVGGEDLSNSLIQFPGTAEPGKIGNAVIFGHSVLPQFFNPKNYLTIFSTLPKLDKGDIVFVNYDGITYKYQVDSIFEVKPSDTQILEQNKTSSYLSLVTCSPPGNPFKPKRLIVRAKLIPYQN